MRVCVAVLFVTACTHHYPVTTLNPASASEEATAQLADGHNVEVRATATPAGPRWIPEGETTATSRIIETTDLRSYTTVSRGRGLAQGLALGGLSGAALGVVTGLASGDDRCPEGNFCLLLFTAKDKAVLEGIAFGGLGLLLGGLLGALVGSHDVYELDSTHMPRISASVAPGHAGGGLSWSF
jgi:hypothetical protein